MNARPEALVPSTPTIEGKPTSIESALRPVPTAQSIQVTRLAAFTPTNLTEAIGLAKLIARSDLAPKEYKGKPENVLIGMQYAAELGIPPLSGLQNISIINGRACLWGDLFLAVIQSSPAYESHKEWYDGSGDEFGAVCMMKRRGQEPHIVKFTIADAKRAHLWDKRGYNNQETPWITSPKRMLQMRARGFAGRDKFADALKGLIIAEEAMDTPVDTSEAKRQRDAATLDIASETPAQATAVSPATIDSLSASTEPNRGHGNEGMNRAAKRADDVMCNECRAINGHLPNCSQKNAPKTIDAKTEQERKTSKPTTAISVLVEGVEKKTKKAKGNKPAQPYLVLSVIDGRNNKFTMYVWKTDLHEYLVGAVNQTLQCEVTESTPDDQNRVYVSLEHIIQIGQQKFVDNKPVTAEGSMPPSGNELFPNRTQSYAEDRMGNQREPGEEDDF